jgi:3-methyladenine DNA glycosylase Tag
MSRELKARGFKFIGSTVCYAHMLPPAARQEVDSRLPWSL